MAGGVAGERHTIRRVRRETRRRTIAVSAIDRLTPSLLRLRFTSPELKDFESAASDDHVKLFVPVGIGQPPVMRDYTPCAFDAVEGTLTLEFALHEAGPATGWALSASIGDKIQIGGPRGSNVVTDDFDWYLLIGDETALPAISRWLRELRPEALVSVLAVVDSDADRLPLHTAAQLTQVWVLRNGQAGDDGERLQQALETLPWPAGDGYVWIAAEAKSARRLRSFVVEARGHPRAWIKAAGYWAAGAEGVHEPIVD